MLTTVICKTFLAKDVKIVVMLWIPSNRAIRSFINEEPNKLNNIKSLMGLQRSERS